MSAAAILHPQGQTPASLPPWPGAAAPAVVMAAVAARRVGKRWAMKRELGQQEGDEGDAGRWWEGMDARPPGTQCGKMKKG
ncbi:hypothetical protein CHU95_20095 [Niveispirillum lacus]|uniref:Uncharacterized protein n=1 Tax=Niveispirillum lacus TaxID=1981099 RepID=A0A255YS33_9PROT|nr:hypothetical protein CHU95_20095 [Niveispirillum lacus]